MRREPAVKGTVAQARDAVLHTLGAVDQISALGASLSSTYGARLPEPTGTDDTAAIQAVLTAHAGERIVTRPGAAYKISAPLVIASGTTLDLTGCTVTLNAGSNCNMIQNTQVVANDGRDADITIIGGAWARGANGGAGTNLHTLRFRRVDGLTIRDATVTSDGGKYAVSLGDVSTFEVSGITFDTASDGIHINGPASRGTIRDIYGTTEDDFVALTARDYASYEDTFGDITDINISNLYPSRATATNAANVVKLLGGTGVVLRRITIKDIHGTNKGAPVTIGAEDQALYPTDVGAVTVDTVDTLNGGGVVNVVASLARDIVLRNLFSEPTTASAYLVNIVAGAVVESLVVDGVYQRSSTSVGSAIVRVEGTATDLSVRNVRAVNAASGNLVALASNGSCARLRLDSVTMSGGSSIISAPAATAVLGTVWASNVFGTTHSWLADIATSTTFYMANVQTLAAQNGSFMLRATANVKVYGTGIQLGGNLTTTVGYSLRVNADWELDVTKVNSRGGGDIARNSNGGAAYGTGRVVTDGSQWKNIFSGALG